MLQLTGYVVDSPLSTTPTGEFLWGTRERDGARVLLKVYDALPGTAWATGQREQALFGRMRSEHVLPALGLTQHGDRVVRAVRAERGISLAALLSGGVPDDARAILFIALQISRLVADAHAAGLVLRDLAPRRFLIDPDTYQVWLLDLGTAIDTLTLGEDEADARDELLGEDMAYRAPECSGRMIRGADARSDLYSLGAVLYHLCAGVPPFSSDDLVELVHAHLTRMPTPLDELNPALPRVFGHLTMRLLSKMPEERYQSAHALHRDLRALTRYVERTGDFDVPTLRGLGERAEFRIPERLYGRSRERAALTAAMHSVRTGTPHLVLLSGEPGIGKSTLARQLTKTFERSWVAEGKCDPLYRGRPYEALRQAFRNLLEQLMTESEARLSVWRQHLSVELGDMRDALVEVVPRLDLLFDQLAADAQRPAPLVYGPVEARSRVALACRRFVDTLAQAEQPLVLLLDDLQWADSGTMALVEALHTERPAHL